MKTIETVLKQQQNEAFLKSIRIKNQYFFSVSNDSEIFLLLKYREDMSYGKLEIFIDGNVFKTRAIFSKYEIKYWYNRIEELYLEGYKIHKEDKELINKRIIQKYSREEKARKKLYEAIENDDLDTAERLTNLLVNMQFLK